MTEDQIPAFVEELLATGCPVYAIGREAYVIAEFEVPETFRVAISEQVNEICERYGKRDHLLLHIAHYLRTVGFGVELTCEIVH
ncbi:MAG: hypothetical protein O9256_02155 [Rhizobiaceae bacterium]|uniref:hypothetical protein n=1 Tax=Rhizobium sp. RU33A TaxID=1907413 RepID=UPI000955C6C0|nr:hypothetical protein [Rhizobium sp. RU33A]MCZ8158680.1 hypothetical protein [Rhizobiaceae bacterium]MCZ8353026.1 hypothetical protein [Rhizobium sp.]SIQ84944.1 hypothetical protein SAMN05880561_10594 [Rhizobium sp. RU33A]